MKKRFLSMLTTLAMVVGLVGVLPTMTTSAEISGDFEYTVLDDGTIEITRCDESVKQVTIPSTIDGKTVTSIGSYAFMECIELQSIELPDTIINIGECAFYLCISLTSILIPDSVISIEQDAFENCASLTEINVSSNNKYYSSQDGILFNYEKTELIKYPSDKKQSTYSILNSVIKVGWSAFECCDLIKIIIPDSVTSIGDYAFYGCSSLTNITIPNSITSIGEYVFSKCTNLTNIMLPDKINEIGRLMFSNCSSLTSITIPNSVTFIGYDAFDECLSLTDVFYSGTEEQWNRISILSGNGDLLNANIHYKSIEIDPIVPTSPTDNTQEPTTELTINTTSAIITQQTNTPKPTHKKTTSSKVTKPAKVIKVKLKAKKKKLNVKWKKISGAKGYQMMSATNKKFTNNKKTVNVKKNKVTLKKLKSKKKYFVKVRAYKTVNGKKVYGKWSKVVSKKVK